ncbi:aromatic ring-hydroxylating oxygenase subunit alpha [Wolbachia endosymbiont (group B) of Melanostoma mellinum]|uniref:aromatic ring-hydroxylating oxygenase subunit alpha n=1 Tax=Wolbachia endosymbiont (group B) of Melanostoma mellinum TaxID=2954030 RepID=UPI00222F34F0|nr:aromatic ring-hydroxylating dioxygenase subunit alpha [Wolbachia endosymbiont (group B) of Melanostoma mellinum]
MMRHALNAEHYISPRTFLLENDRIFSKLWIFVGFSSMVRRRNQFFTRKVAGIPILVQRTKAGIRAFVNQCPHRLSAIQMGYVGQRPLVCPYHAWSFGPEGELRAIPNSALYNFTAEEQSEICLQKLHLEEVGKLLFVNLAVKPIPLNEQFTDDYLDILREVSLHLDSRLIYSCHRVRYNWKLNMENVQDSNHVPFIHSKTLLPFITSPIKMIKHEPKAPSKLVGLLQLGKVPDLSSLSYSAQTPLQHLNKSWFANLCYVYGDKYVYYSWYIYPNVNFCSVLGEYFLLQQYDPISPGETDYHLWMMTARRKDESTDFTALLNMLIKKERMVIAEDTIVLEHLQEGISNRSKHFTHGDYEAHLVLQHLWYRSQVVREAE